MFTLIYCPELNAYRLREMNSGKQRVLLEQDIDDVQETAPWLRNVADYCKTKPNEEQVICQ